MIIQSKYTKIFKSNYMTRLKYNELYDFAVLIRNHKNIVSEYVNQNILHFLEYSKFTFLKEMREHFKYCVPSSFDAQLYTQIFDCYQNKFDAIQKRLRFEHITYLGCELYKRTTKKHSKGDFKNVITERKQTLLSNCLTYLARYGNDSTIEYITKQLGSCDEKKKDFYNNILRCVEKFSFDRLMNLAIQKRNRVISRYIDKPIEFKSLSFSGRCRKTKIIDYNSKFGSVINAYISLSGLGRKSFDIPVKFNKDWHGNIKKYYKKNPDYEYTLTFNEIEHQVNIHLCADGERYIPQAGNNIVGIDVNCKHNLFALSNETTYDYDRKLVNDFCKLSLEIDKLKENKSYVIGKRKQWKLDTLKHKMIHSEQHMIATMCKKLQRQGVNHIVMEDLDNGFGKCYVKDSDNEDINYNRKVKFLGLSSLKQEVEHIARKYDIAVSTVHSSYTSKMCPICGCIEDDNRPNQETFECIECGYSSNADFNAANNIKNRVSITVLCNSLLKQMDNGAYEPKNLKREKVKEVLLSFRRNLQKVGSERIECGMTTFDYIQFFGSINRKKIQWTEGLIIEKLSQHLLSSSSVRYLMNNLYVFSNSWESDYLSLTNSGYFYEGEVKISKSDFKADFKKEKKHLILENNFNKTQTDNNLCPHYFFYAVPEGLIDVSEVPEYAGLIYMIDVYPYYKWIKKAPLLHKVKYNDIDLKLQDKFYYNMINWKRKALKEYPHQINKMKELIKESKTDENGKKYCHTLSEYDNLLKIQEEINENQKQLIYNLLEECKLYKDEIRTLKKEREV